MKTERQELSTVLRLLVSPRPPADDPPDWEFASAVARRAGLEAVLHRRGEGAPDTLRSTWEKAFREVQAGNLLRMAAYEEIAASLSGSSVPFVPLKGLDMIRSGLYPEGERPMRDLDVFVPPEAFVEACGALDHIGFERGPVMPGQQVMLRRPVVVELHHELFPGRVPVARCEREYLQRSAATGDGTERRLDPGDRIEYLCLHFYLGEVHRARSATLLRDLAALVDRGPRPDGRALVERARGHGSLPFLARRFRELQALLGEDLSGLARALLDAARKPGTRMRTGFRLSESEARRRLLRDLPEAGEPGLRFFLLFWGRWRDMPRIVLGAASREGGGLWGRFARLCRRYLGEDGV